MASMAGKYREERANGSMSSELRVMRRGQRQRMERNQGLMEEGKWALLSCTHRCSTSASRRRRGPWREWLAWLSSRGGLGVWKTWRVDTRWRKEKWHDSPCARLMSMPWRRRMGGMGAMQCCLGVSGKWGQ